MHDLDHARAFRDAHNRAEAYECPFQLLLIHPEQSCERFGVLWLDEVNDSAQHPFGTLEVLLIAFIDWGGNGFIHNAEIEVV
jgi:hypothetical protein